MVKFIIFWTFGFYFEQLKVLGKKPKFVSEFGCQTISENIKVEFENIIKYQFNSCGNVRMLYYILIELKKFPFSVKKFK